MRFYNERVTLHSGATGTANGTVVVCDGITTVGVQLSGTWVATVTFEGTLDGTNWVSVQMSNIATGAVGTTATANGIYVGVIAGVRQFRARVSSYTSGTVVAVAFGTAAGGGQLLADVDIAGTEDVTISGFSASLPAGTNAIGKLAANSGVDIGDVDVLSIAAGNNNIGDVDVASIAAGDNNIGNVDVASIAAGDNNIGNVDVASIAAGDNNIGNVDIVTQPAAECATVAEYNLTLTNANTEYSQGLPANCRKVIFRCRTAYDVRYAWVTGKVATPTAPYQTLRASAEYALDGVKIASGTLYFASATAAVVMEIEAWS